MTTTVIAEYGVQWSCTLAANAPRYRHIHRLWRAFGMHLRHGLNVSVEANASNAASPRPAARIIECKTTERNALSPLLLMRDAHRQLLRLLLKQRSAIASRRVI